MSRLPVPGQDNGVWGNLLNDYLLVAHNANGTLRSSVLAGKADDTSVVHLAGTETITGAKTFSSAPIVPAASFPQNTVTNLASDLAAKEAVANKGVASGYAPLDGASKVPTANLGGNGASSSTYLRGDQTWVAISSSVTNVKDFGAVGDGTTDDTAAIGSAITALSAGATLLFPEGTYVTSGVTITGKNDITVSGAGAFLVGSSQADPICTIVNSSRVRVVGLHIRHASISGGRTSGGYGLRVLGCTNVDIESVSVTTVTSAAFWLLGNTGIRVRGCSVDGSLADGIHLNNDTTYGPCIDATIVGNTLRNTADDGIAVVSQAASGVICGRVTITGNTVYNSAARGIAVVGGDGVTIAGNTVSLTANAGIYIAQETSYATYGTTNVNVTSNTVMHALTAAGSSAAQAAIHVICGDAARPLSAIHVGGNLIIRPRREFIWVDGAGTSVSDVTIQGNHLVGPPTTTTGIVGILIGGAVVGCQVAANRINLAGTHGMQSYGTDVHCTGNTIYKPNQANSAGTWGIQRVGGSIRARENQVVPDDTKTALSGTITAGPTSVAAGANAGGSPPPPIVVSGTSSSDDSGQINFGSGSAPSAGAQLVVTFQSPFAVAPRVVLVARNAATATLGLYVSAVSASAFTVSTATAPTASQADTTYLLEYVVELV